ncbi:Rpn family recombination-promoting nuclease/putative transposase, partial [Alistipes senegalensis]|uniref:Rpn family recombination-promoting nuclease/putative transposase n=1 Tax=Alistipes senegalensis TaxID=1288121 RepID=UPI00248E10AC
DILGEDSKGRLILFEIQNNNEYAYFQRMLFGVSKLVTEYLNRGQGYESIRKVYSINIVYFSLGSGTDIVYHGKTEFRGIHNNELLRLSPFQQQTFKVSEVSNLYPEYYILRVNDFNRWSKIPLEQWIYFLNTGEIPEEANAPGLPEARERLKLDRLSKDELKAYYRHLDNVVILRDNILTERAEGRVEGHAEGRVEGLAEGRAEGRVEGRAEGEHVRSVEIARKMKIKGMSVSDISDMTGLDVEEIEQIDRF